MDRNDQILLTALAIFMLTVIVLAALSAVSPQCVHTPANGNVAEVLQNPEQITPCDPGGDDPQFFGDTYAQWIMAAFTVIGAGISLYAVILVNRTLQTSRDASSAAVEAVTAANAANDLMRQDQRPWLKLSIASVGPIDLRFNSVSARVVVENIGPTPALDVRVSIRPVIVRTVRPDKSFVARFLEHAITNAENTDLARGVIFPNQDTSVNVNADHIGEVEIERQFERGPVKVAIIFVCTYRSSRTDKHFHTCITAIAWEQLGTSTRPFTMDGGYGIEQITFETNDRLTSVS